MEMWMMWELRSKADRSFLVPEASAPVSILLEARQPLSLDGDRRVRWTLCLGRPVCSLFPVLGTLRLAHLHPSAHYTDGESEIQGIQLRMNFPLRFLHASKIFFSCFSTLLKIHIWGSNFTS